MKKLFLLLSITFSCPLFGAEPHQRLAQNRASEAEKTSAQKLEEIDLQLFYLFNAVVKKAVKDLVIHNYTNTDIGTVVGAARAYTLQDSIGDPHSAKIKFIKSGLNDNAHRWEALKAARSFYQHWVRFENYKEKSTAKIGKAIEEFEAQIKDAIRQSFSR